MLLCFLICAPNFALVLSKREKTHDFRNFFNSLDLTLLHRAAYCVVAKESVGKQISIAFLERMKTDFKQRYGGGKADTAVAKSLNKEFGYVSELSFRVPFKAFCDLSGQKHILS